MITGPRDLYVLAESWKTIVSLVAPKPQGMEAGFSKACEQFEQYSETIKGDVGDAIRRCYDHLQRFTSAAKDVVIAESGENSARLGRPREFLFGEETLIFQVFTYKGKETVSIREDRMANLLTFYDRFHDTMSFMEKKVEEGNLGLLKNTFLFIHKPLQQAAEQFDKAIESIPLQHTTIIGQKPDPTYVHVSGTEPSQEIEAGHICRVLKPGYAFDGREIQEGVVLVAE
ncbi:MAG: nucleotide exchange factor GrpE [Candidatus Omnitrophica bacterium]|nr:nucleotide exchange factor GrpE [Candidatus Omnitrophota bacterium]